MDGGEKGRNSALTHDSVAELNRETHGNHRRRSGPRLSVLGASRWRRWGHTARAIGRSIKAVACPAMADVLQIESARADVCAEPEGRRDGRSSREWAAVVALGVMFFMVTKGPVFRIRLEAAPLNGDFVDDPWVQMAFVAIGATVMVLCWPAARDWPVIERCSVPIRRSWRSRSCRRFGRSTEAERLNKGS